MLLPTLITAVLARTKDDGSPVFRQTATEILLPSVPPSTQVVLEVSPTNPTWMILMYRMQYGDTPVNSFDLELLQAGALLKTGRLTQDDIATGTDTWVIIRQSTPVTLEITNEDTINAHPFRLGFQFVVIDNRQDWEEIQSYFNRVLVGA